MADLRPVYVAGDGDVKGPTSSSNNFLPLFADTTGKLLKSSGTGVTTQGLAILDDNTPAEQRNTIGLDQVNNTSDVNKPVSTAQQAALHLKQDKLLYTPVQQGGGIGQTTNKIFIGFGAGRLKATVDSTDFGNVVFDGNTATESLVGVAKIATISLAQGGTNNTDMMTPLRVRQAINNVAPGQATETTLGIARIATTTESQHGVNDTRMMTPLKTRQAIDNMLPVHATTTLAGIAKIASTALAIAGTDKNTIITPALLKKLFPKRVFKANDFIRIPDVPGGLIIQMGIGTSYPGATVIQTLPTPFPNRLLTCGAQTTEAWSSDITVRFIPTGDKKSTFYLDNSYTTSGPAYYWAIGY